MFSVCAFSRCSKILRTQFVNLSLEKYNQQALKDSDQDLASILMQRLEILESCRMDPTQDEGSYQRDLDVDEWYEADRRRARQG